MPRAEASVAKVYVVGPNGERVSLADQALVAYALNCGHLGRDYAVQRRDLMFCPDCGVNKRVSRILAT